jgi:hypothetical protein
MSDAPLTMIQEREELISLLPPGVREAWDKIPKEQYMKSDVELELSFTPTMADWSIRKRMWEKYDLAKKTNARELKLVSVYGEDVSRSHFYRVLNRDFNRFPWYMSRPPDSDELIELGAKAALQKMAHFLLNHTPDARSATVYLKYADIFLNRQYGAVAQRIEQKNLNLNKTIGSRTVDDPNDLLEKMKDMQKQLSPKDVTPSE